MEQYELDPRFCASDIQRILKRFNPLHIFIRRVGNQGGGTIVSEDLQGKALEIKRNMNELLIFIGGKKKFVYEQDPIGSEFRWGRRFGLAYEREPSVCPSTGFDDPYDSNLPLVSHSIIRGVNWNYYMQIRFEGMIPIEKTRPWFDPIYYWKLKRKPR